MVTGSQLILNIYALTSCVERSMAMVNIKNLR